MMTFIMARAMAPSEPGLGWICTAAREANQVTCGSMTMSLVPPLLMQSTIQ